MDNRIINGQTFESHYFDPTRNTRKNKKGESHIDFYIFFSDDVSVDNICSFHVPYSYVYEYSHVSFQSEEEAFIIEILLHQNVNNALSCPDSTIESIYLALLEYFAYGEDIFFAIKSFQNMGCGLLALFDESFHRPTITQIIDPNVNKERFYYKEVS